MSWSKEVTCWCDGEVEGLKCNYWKTEPAPKTVAKKVLRSRGWTFGKAGDLCPKCSKERKKNGRRIGMWAQGADEERKG